MSNNQQGANPVMYYYVNVAMPGQMGQYPQNGDGSMQGQTVPTAVFGDASQMQNFSMGNQQYGFVPAQDGNGMAMQMGQAPALMANGAMNMGGQQVMLVMNMAGQQSNQMMEQGHGNAWNPCGQDSSNGQNSGVMMQQQFQQQAQPQQQPQQQVQQQQPQQSQQQSQQFQITPPQKQGESRADNKESSDQGQSTAQTAAAKPAAKRKGLQNKKLDKKDPAVTSDPSGGSASQPTSTSTSAPATAQPAQAETERQENQTPQISRWPPPAASLGANSQRAPSSGSNSAIKALNLEPMRANNAPASGRPKPLRKEILPLDVPQPTSEPPAQAQTQPEPSADSAAPAPKATPAPAASAPTPATPAPPATQGATTGKKNFKLKNAALTRTKTTEIEGQNKENKEKENKEEKLEKPIAEIPVVANVPDEVPSARQANQVKLMPPNKVFDRELMLRIWRLQRSEVHASVSGLGTGERPAERPIQRSDRRPATGGKDLVRPSKYGRDAPSLKPSENAYRITEPTGRMEELGRRVRALLNKICPDNLKTIVETLASIELQKAEELEYVIKIIFGKALVEPHYCETYADMVFALRTRYPEFPAENEGEKPHSFTRVLLNTVQNEFESLPTTFEPSDDDRAKFPNPEDLNIEMKKRKGKMLANMKFIGNLFLRQLLAVKVIGQVVHDLVGIKEGNALPEEHMIECVCELLQAIGFTLDETPQGESLMSSFASRLKDISSIRTDGKAAFGKRIQFSIEYLLELRKNKWQKKLFKEQAKTKAAVRDEFDREARQHGRGNAQDGMFSFQTVGVRPAYIDDIANQKKRTKTEAAPQKVKFDQAYVKKICHYFGEEKDGDSLQTDWGKAQPNDKETKQGLEWLLEMGLDDDKKADVVAMTLAEIMKRKLAPWEALKECFAASLSRLPDLKMDAPHCDSVVHCLLARLLMLDNFNPVILKPIQSFVSHNDNRELGWSLMLGIIKKLKSEKAQDIVKKAISLSEFASCAATAKNTSVPDAKKQLESA